MYPPLSRAQCMWTWNFDAWLVHQCRCSFRGTKTPICSVKMFMNCVLLACLYWLTRRLPEGHAVDQSEIICPVGAHDLARWTLKGFAHGKGGLPIILSSVCFHQKWMNLNWYCQSIGTSCSLLWDKGCGMIPWMKCVSQSQLMLRLIYTGTCQHKHVGVGYENAGGTKNKSIEITIKDWSKHYKRAQATVKRVATTHVSSHKDWLKWSRCKASEIVSLSWLIDANRQKRHEAKQCLHSQKTCICISLSWQHKTDHRLCLDKS